MNGSVKTFFSGSFKKTTSRSTATTATIVPNVKPTKIHFFRYYF